MGQMSEDELRDIRGNEIAMIYQEPMASLNPAMKIGKQLMEVPMIHEGASEGRGLQTAPSRWSPTSNSPTPNACFRELPAPAFRRPTAAYRDCYGLDVKAFLAHPGRANNRA